MKKTILGIIASLLFITGCGLKYTPTETPENKVLQRKNAVEEYIRVSYADSSSIVYQPLLFGQPTVMKPHVYQQLDSLYEIKFNNEQRGITDRKLEAQIKNQLLAVQNSTEKITYVEHHIYSIQKEKMSNVYFADVYLNNKSYVTDFAITENYQFPSNLLSIFKSYITRESLLYPTYAPTEEELEFYNYFETQLNLQPSYRKNSFMTTSLTVFLLARNARTLETKPLLQHMAVIQSDNRQFNSQKDVIHSVDGIWNGEVLDHYEVKYTTPSGTFKAKFSPYFEILELNKIVI